VDMTSGRRVLNAAPRGVSVWRAIACLAGCAALALAAAGCGSSSDSPGSRSSLASFYTGGTPGGTPVKGGVVTIDQGESVKTLSPIGILQPDEVQIGREIYDQLFEYLPGSPSPQPGLAESYTVSTNGLVYVFNIRPHVYFSNGEALTAGDVIFSLKSLSLPASGMAAPLSLEGAKYSVPSPDTVRLELKRPSPGLIGNLGLVETSIMPKKVVEREGFTAFAHHPVGTGPFMLQSATPTFSTVKLVRNPHYWHAGQPYLDGLVFNEVTETNSRILAVRSGTATVATGISFSQVAALRTTPGVRVLVEPLQNAVPVFLNEGFHPLNNVNVRRALNYATPREEIIRAVFKGMGEPSNDPVGRLQYWDSKVPAYPFSLSKARQLLKDSPAAHGFDVTVSAPSGEPDAGLIASILQSTWAKIGVHVTIQTVDATSFFSDIFASKYQIGIWNDEGYVTEQYPPDLALFGNFDYSEASTHSGGTNFHSPRVDALLKEALSTPEPAKRPRLFGEVQDLLIKEAADITIAELPSRTLVSSSLRGFQVLPGNAMPLWQAWLAK
jgi:peptide/nickel transport system substrate-binding protein